MLRQKPDLNPIKINYTLRFLLVIIGILLPLITLTRQADPGKPDLLSRVQPVDLVALACLAAFLPTKKLRIHPISGIYGLSLLLSLCIGVLSAADSSEITLVFTSFFALCMAWFYWIIGYNAGLSRPLAKGLLWGIVLSVCWEGAIVLHDYLFRPMWFQDTQVGRVRGTFVKNGQLGAYGFSTAGILITLGWFYLNRRLGRWMTVLCILLSVFFVWAASRRSGLMVLAVWVLFLTLVVLYENLNRRFLLPAVGSALLVVPLVVSSINLTGSMTGQELVSGVQDLEGGNTFFMMQLNAFTAQSEKWFPFGLGAGRAQTLQLEPELNGIEIHDAHLALLVEIGLFGLLSFYALACLPIFRRWNGNSRTRLIVISFIFVAAVFALHNRLHRDRSFMVFLGMAAALSETSRAPKTQQERFLENEGELIDNIKKTSRVPQTARDTQNDELSGTFLGYKGDLPRQC